MRHQEVILLMKRMFLNIPQLSNNIKEMYSEPLPKSLRSPSKDITPIVSGAPDTCPCCEGHL